MKQNSIKASQTAVSLKIANKNLNSSEIDQGIKKKTL